MKCSDQGWTAEQLDDRQTSRRGQYACPVCGEDCRTPAELDGLEARRASRKGVRARNAARKAALERAFLERAKIIGLMECCKCTYPVERHSTDSGHEETCPAHPMVLSSQRAYIDGAKNNEPVLAGVIAELMWRGAR